MSKHVSRTAVRLAPQSVPATEFSLAKPDVIVMEAALPDGDGFTFCREIRGQTSAYILFLTGKTDNEDAKQGLRSGGDMYVTKPFHMPELMARIEAAMWRRRSEGGPQ